MSEGLTVETKGLKAALSECVDTSTPVPGSAAAVQPLLPLPLRQVAADEPDAEPGAAARGAGRPKGSKNKSTQEWREYLLARYASPLVALAETYSRSPLLIAAEMGYDTDGIGENRNGRRDRRASGFAKYEGLEKRRRLDDRRQRPFKRRVSHEMLLEIFKIQLQCAKELAPYVHQKQPMAIDGNGAGLINLILQTGAATAQQVAEAGVMPFHFVDGETVKDQPLIGQQGGKLDVGKSDAGNQHTDTEQQNTD